MQSNIFFVTFSTTQSKILDVTFLDLDMVTDSLYILIVFCL